MRKWQMFDTVEVRPPDGPAFDACVIDWDDGYVTVQDDTGQTFEYAEKYVVFIEHEIMIAKI